MIKTSPLSGNPKHLWRDTTLIFLASLLVFIIGLSHHEFINFESRFALFAQDMFAYGVHFFPTIYGVPYPDYPSTALAFIYLFSLPAHHVIVIAAVLPTAIMAALSLAFIYLIAAPHSRKWGGCSVLFCLSTVFFLDSARSISLDLYTTVVTAFCFYAVYAEETYQSRRLSYFIPLVLLFGFVCRGPIGLVIPSGVVCGYFLVSGQWMRLIRFAIIAAILLIIFTALLLAAAHHQGGGAFMHQVLTMQVIGRLATENSPWFFYFKTVWGNYAIALPFAVLVLLGYLPKIFSRTVDKRQKLLQYLAIWTLIILVGMSIPGEKKTRYILAIAPAISIIAAYLFIATDQVFWLRSLRRIVTWIFFLFPFLLAALTLIARNYAHHHDLQFDINYDHIFISLAVLQIIAIVCALLMHGFTKKETIALLVATLSFIDIHIFIVEKAEQRLNNARTFVKQAEQLQLEKPNPLCFYRIQADGAAIKYFVHADREVSACYLNTPPELLALAKNTYVIMKNEDYQTLSVTEQKQLNTLLAGNFGRDEALMLEVR